MYYIVYKTINLINGKIYIGKHKTEKLDFDGYFGSGLRLNRAISKYGIENFERKTLYIYNNDKECSDKERELVNENFCDRDDTYNIALGGNGGNTIYSYSDDEKNKIFKLRGESIKKSKSKMNDNIRNLYRERMKLIRIQPDNKNRKHIGESLQNIIDANHMRNKTWYTDGINNIVLNKEIDEIPINYYEGRTFDESQKFKGHSTEVLKSLSEKRKSGNYYNNGKINIYIHVGDEIPKGFIQGMKQRDRKEKYSWYTDGINNIGLYDNDEIPKNYYKGRTIKNKGNKNK